MKRVRIVRKEEIADGTLAVYLERPPGFEYRAGQYAFFAIPKDPRGERLERHFTFASAPYEKELMFATRMREGSDYKRALLSCSAGAELEMEGPYGEFLLRDDEQGPLVGIAGGIGITPFFSIIKDAKERRVTRPITLFYSDRDPDSAAFLEEIYGIAEDMPGSRMVATMTDTDGSRGEFSWEGERGQITEDMVRRYVEAPHKALFYASGPFDMVRAAKDMVRGMGVLDSRLRTETFSGY